MKARRVQMYVVVALTIIALIFSSSKNVLNIKERVFVHALGIDNLENGEGFKVTMQVFKPQGTGSDTPVDVLQSNIQVVQSSGKTVRQALAKAQNSLGREIFLGHLQVICLNKNVDFSNPENLFEFCLKDKNVFLGVKLCIGKNTAEEIMKTQITRGTTTSESFVDTIEKSGENSTSADCELIDFLSCVNCPTYVALPVLEIKEIKEIKKTEQSSQNSEENKDKQQSEQSQNSQESQEPEIEINNTAIVNNGKVMDDFLDEKQTVGYCLLSDKGKFSEFSVDYQNKQIDIKLDKEKLSKKVVLKNGQFVVNCKFKAKITTEFDDEKTKEKMREKVKTRTEKVMENAVNKTFYENHSDVYDVWKLIRQSYPNVYLKYKNYIDDLYDNVKFNFVVDIK